MQKCGVSLRKNGREGIKESVHKSLGEKEPSVPLLSIVWPGTHGRNLWIAIETFGKET